MFPISWPNYKPHNPKSHFISYYLFQQCTINTFSSSSYSSLTHTSVIYSSLFSRRSSMRRMKRLKFDFSLFPSLSLTREGLSGGGSDDLRRSRSQLTILFHSHPSISIFFVILSVTTFLNSSLYCFCSIIQFL